MTIAHRFLVDDIPYLERHEDDGVHNPMSAFPDAVEVDEPAWDAAYTAYVAAQSELRPDLFGDTAEHGRRSSRRAARLMWSRSPHRAGPQPLDQAVLDSGRLYAIWLEGDDSTWSEVDFDVDGSTHTEVSAPFDAFGTAGDGKATRDDFTSGGHTVSVAVTDAEGTFVVAAAFEAE